MTNTDMIKDIKFNKANIGGYKIDEVDNFIESVITMIEKFKERENNLLLKIENLESIIKDYKSDEHYIKDVLVSAKKLADEEIKEAKLKAENIIKEASEKTNDLISERDLELKSKQNMLNQMKKEVSDFKSRLMNEYKAHLKMISSIERNYNVNDIAQEASEYESNTTENDSKKTFESKDLELEEIKSKVEKKFDQLGGIKFGANYDINNDIESPVKLFG